MKNTSKIKITITTAKVALLYTDNSTKFVDETLIGKYNIKSAEKYINSGNFTSDYANVKNAKVLDVETSVKEFTVDTLDLYTFVSTNTVE